MFVFICINKKTTTMKNEILIPIKKIIIPEGTKVTIAPLLLVAFVMKVCGFGISFFTDVPALESKLFSQIYENVVISLFLSIIVSVAIEFGFSGGIKSALMQYKVHGNRVFDTPLFWVAIIVTVTCLTLTSYFSLSGLQMQHIAKIGSTPQKDITVIQKIGKEYDSRKKAVSYELLNIPKYDAEIAKLNEEIERVSKKRDAYPFAKQMRESYNSQISEIRSQINAVMQDKKSAITQNNEIYERIKIEKEGIEKEKSDAVALYETSYQNTLAEYNGKVEDGKINSWVGNLIAVIFIIMSNLIEAFSDESKEDEKVTYKVLTPFKESDVISFLAEKHFELQGTRGYSQKHLATLVNENFKGANFTQKEVSRKMLQYAEIFRPTNLKENTND